MITQKPISLKIEFDLLQELDHEAACGWRKRNNLINEAVRFYLDYLDTRRRIKTYGDHEDREDEFSRFTRKYFPDMAK